jgi:hypothetical protein
MGKVENGNKGGCGALILIIIVLCVVIGGCQSLFGGHSDSDSIVPAQEAVKDMLKSPSTADFCDNDTVSKDEDTEGYIVEGCVDAQNGFGATVRIDYTVYLDKDDNFVDMDYNQR